MVISDLRFLFQENNVSKRKASKDRRLITLNGILCV